MPVGQQTIITLYGTFAGRPSGSEWWENNSPFAKDLLRELNSADPQALFSYESFDWDPWGHGANSESVRRASGRALLNRLREQDRLGRDYHLVGHSHGGSVIWRALLLSVAERRPLKHLQSWTTVGTPFLEFRAQLRSLWAILPVSLSALWAWLFVSNSGLRELPQAVQAALRFSNQPALVLLSVGLAVLLVLLAAVGILAGVGYLRTWLLDPAKLRMRAQAFATYGGRYLGLFHPLDEVRAGFAVSLNRPDRIAPRPLIKIGRFSMALPLSELWTRPLDQLAWQVVGRSVQGDDVLYENLVRVTTSPYPAIGQRSGYSTAELDAHEASTSAAASHLLHDFRRALAREATAEAARPESVFGVVDWAGILHTSFFEQPSTAIRIAQRILRTPPTDSELQAPGIDPPPSRYSPRMLVTAFASLSTALVLALSVSASQLNRGSVVPYMLSAFVERVLDASSDDRLLQTPSSDLPGQMWTRVNEISFHYPWVVGPNLAEQTRGLIEVESAERSILAFAAYIGRLGGPAIADNLRRVQKSYRGAEEDGLTTQRQVDTALIEIPVVAVSEYMRSHPEIAELPPELLPMMEQAVAQLGFQSILLPRQLDHLPFGPVRFSAYALFERIGLSAHLPPDLLSKAPNCILAKPVGLWLLRSGEVRRAIALQKHCTLQAIAEGISAMLRADHDYEAVSQYLQAFDPLFAGPGPGCADQSRCADIRAVDFANYKLAGPSEELICRSVVCATLEALSNDEAATEQAAALVNLWQADGDACRTAGDLWGAWTHVVSELSSPFPEEVSALIAECSRGDSSSGRFVIQQLQTTPMPERLALAEALKTRQLEPYPSLQETCGLVPTTLVAYEAVADPTGEIAFVRRAMKRIIEVRNSAAKREYALPCLNALASAGRRLGDYDTAALARSVSLEQFGEDQARSSHAADVAEAALEAVLSGDYPTAFKYVDGSDADPALRLRVLIALADGAIVHLTAPEDFPEELNPL